MSLCFAVLRHSRIWKKEGNDAELQATGLKPKANLWKFTANTGDLALAQQSYALRNMLSSHVLVAGKLSTIVVFGGLGV